jgi:hypothetical protein
MFCRIEGVDAPGPQGATGEPRAGAAASQSFQPLPGKVRPRSNAAGRVAAAAECKEISETLHKAAARSPV